MITLRAGESGDVNFVMNSWLKSCRKTYKTISADDYYRDYGQLCERLLRAANCLVACDNEDPTFIHGYLVYTMKGEIPVVHWAYVKDSFRKLGIFKTMLKTLEPELLKDPKHPVVITFQGAKYPLIKNHFKFVHKPELRY